METNSLDVQQNSSSAVSEDVTTQTPVMSAEVAQSEPVTPAPGSKTPEANLLAALHEERRMRKELEDKLLQAQTSVLPDTDDVYSDEGKILKAEIEKLNSTISRLEDERTLEVTFSKFPELKEFAGDFESFRKDFPRHKIENVAKLFLAEKGLLATEPRKGLEKPTGGDKTPQSSGLTAEEIKNLRQNDFRKYQQMLLEGKIEVK